MTAPQPIEMSRKHIFELGYNINGFANHSLLSAIDIIGRLGYKSIAVTIDHHALNPWDKSFETQLVQVKERLKNMTWRLWWKPVPGFF